MQHKYRSLNRFLSVILIVSITLMNTNIALADDSSPPEPTPTFESTEQPIDPMVSTTETTVVETPPIEETPTVVEATATSEPIVEPTQSAELPTEPPVDVTQVPPETPVVEENSAPVKQAPITELLSQAPENTELVVLDENGQALSLTSQEALDTILDTDPMWCPAGVLPGGVGCSVNFATIAALLTSMRTTPSNYSQDGVIYFTTTPGASFSLTNTATSLGNSGFTTLSTFNLTLQGGWNGLSGASATFIGQTNFGSNTLTVGTAANPWVGSITLTNFTFSGVSSSNAVTVYTNPGNITLNNVDVAQQSGNNYTALLNSNSGNITVQNGSSFDGNNSGANQNRGFRAETTTGSITITGTSSSPITFADAKGCLVVFICLIDTVVNYNGASLYAPNVTLNYVTANNNDLNGIEIFNANSVTLNNVVSTNNGTNILLLPDQLDVGSGVYVNGTGSTLVLVNGGTFSNNERYGLEIINGTMDFVVNPTCNANQLGCTNDTTPPVLSLPANMTVEATGPSGAAVAYSATADDNLWGSVTVTCSPASGSTFPLGITTVNCSASDPEGNTANGSFTVTVQDTTGPVITVPADITVEAESSLGTVVTYAASANDLVDGSVSVTCDPASGSLFPLGDTTVTCNATDSRGNAAIPASFVIHVVDTTAPVIDPHPDITVEATSPAGADVTYISPATSDAVDGPGVATCSPASGSTFPIGDTTVTCNAMDTAGNAATPTTFVVHVVDTTPPVIDPHPDVTVEATSSAGAIVDYISPATSDIVDGPGVATCSPPAGGTFPLGDTTVTCNATDANGNVALPTTFVIHVVDTTAPVIDPLPDITVEATSPAGATVTYTSPATSDAVDGPGVATCTPTSGNLFPLGDTTITCNATDSHGNVAIPTTFVIHVVDTIPPVIEPHPDITVEATSPAGATVTYTSPATSDIVDGSGIATCTPASGSTFPLGDTTVTCNATDTSGNAATPTTFVVHVVDTIPPVIAPHADITVPATSPSGAVVNYTSPATSDAADGPGVAICSPASGSLFPLGNTTITCNATDAAGNVAIPTTFIIHVIDTTPIIDPHPDITVPATSVSGAIVTYTSPATFDAVDGPGVATCSPTSGNLFSIGNTTITCNATDSAGNAATPVTFVIHVVDTSPVIAAHTDVTAEATSSAGAIVTYSSPVTSDAVDGPGVATCTPVSGSTLSLGNTTITCNATDSAGNAATPTTFVVHVVDTTAPVIATHADITVETVSGVGVIVNYTLPATSDAVDVPGVATCSPAPLSTFPIGDTTVTCNATDSHGNAATPTTFIVHVVDTIAPVIEYHADETVEATSSAGATVNYSSPATSDAVDGPGVASCTPASGSTLPLGNTTITCNAIDVNGNSATPTTFVIHVVDTTASIIAAHTDVTVEATSPSGATVNYTRPATFDAVDGAGTASCSPPPGAVFPLGNTTVTCNAADSHGNTAASTSFIVRVVDTTGPVIHPHADVTVTINNTLGTIATYSSPSTSDAVDGQGVASCNPASGSFFPVGDTLITCNAIDSLGHTATPITFTVHVKYKPFIDKDTLPQGTNLSVPVTGGSLIDLDCLTVVNVFGIKVTFHNLCDHQSIIDDMDATTLPAELPEGYSFVKGLNVIVLFEGQVVEALPIGTGVQLDFPVPANAQDQFAVLLWDDQDGDGIGEWLDVTQLIKDQELSKVLSADPNDELYELVPTKTLETFYRVVTTEKTGTFVLVKK